MVGVSTRASGRRPGRRTSDPTAAWPRAAGRADRAGAVRRAAVLRRRASRCCWSLPRWSPPWSAPGSASRRSVAGIESRRRRPVGHPAVPHPGRPRARSRWPASRCCPGWSASTSRSAPSRCCAAPARSPSGPRLVWAVAALRLDRAAGRGRSAARSPGPGQLWTYLSNIPAGKGLLLSGALRAGVVLAGPAVGPARREGAGRTAGRRRAVRAAAAAAHRPRVQLVLARPGHGLDGVARGRGDRLGRRAGRGGDLPGRPAGPAGGGAAAVLQAGHLVRVHRRR